MWASFVADGDETNSRLSVAEWWLESNTVAPHTPNPHSHPEDHLFYVIEGEVSVLLDTEWRTGTPGTYIYIPGGTEHTFENRTSSRSGFVSITNPGGFEAEMPGIVQWFEKKPQSP
jgi:mannose-6-phosphate isomerase-like protein (cupin superfamily)